MKDKRQKMAVSWPYGLADPRVYAYLLSTAASLQSQQYHYAGGTIASQRCPPPPPAALLDYFANLELHQQRTAASLHRPFVPFPPLPAPLLATESDVMSTLRSAGIKDATPPRQTTSSPNNGYVRCFLGSQTLQQQQQQQQQQLASYHLPNVRHFRMTSAQNEFHATPNGLFYPLSERRASPLDQELARSSSGGGK